MTADGASESRNPGGRLTLYIFVAIVLAVVLALTIPHVAMQFKVGGEIFLRILMMMVVPLVMASVMSGIIGLGDVRKLGKPGVAAVTYYGTTTVLAVLLGLVAVNVIEPGVGTVDPEYLESFTGEEIAHLEESKPESVGDILENLVLMLFTRNLILSAAEANLLPLIFFSIVFASMLTTMGSRIQAITEMIVQVNDALLNFVLLLMKFAPFGIFCLVTARFGEARAEGQFLAVLSQTGWYFLTVLLALAIHAFVTLPFIYWVFTKKNPYRFMAQMSQAILTAFSTASSSATLPITMKSAIGNAGLSKKSVEFVIPVGATINMDGTALYEAIAAIFIAQAIGLELTLVQQGVVAVTATLAAIGAAGIPEAGLVTMLIVLNAVGLPAEYIGLILSVDWLLDRFRTATNTLGDSIGAAVVEKAFD